MRRLASLGLVSLSLGCGSSGETADAEASGTEAGESEGTEGPAAPVNVPARGIWLTSVEVNQGVAVQIGRDGAWVDGPDRNAPLVRDRDTLLRAFWAFDEGWEPRPIEARLGLFYSDGTSTEYSQVVMIDGESTAGDIMRTFYFGLLADEVDADMQYQISLYETEAEFAGGDDPVPLPVTPVDGPGFVGIEAAPMEMFIHVIPFNSAWSGCSATPDTSEETMQLLEDRMYQRNPLIDISITLEPSIDFTTQPASFWSYFADIDDARIAAGLGDNHYWYGLADPCANELDGAGGLAMSIPPATQQAGRERIAAGLSGDPDFTATTLVHEIGHLQGLRHVSCAANPTDNDPAFPYPDAKIGVWGFGVRDFILRHPDVSRDYMSYCYGNSWTADWSWWRTHTRVLTLTSWDYGGGAAPPPDQPLLVGVVSATGAMESTESWWISEGSLAREGLGNVSVVFEGAAGSQTIAGHVHALADSDAITIAVPLPAAGLADIRRVHVSGAGIASRDVAIDTIRARSAPGR